MSTISLFEFACCVARSGTELMTASIGHRTSGNRRPGPLVVLSGPPIILEFIVLSITLAVVISASMMRASMVRAQGRIVPNYQAK